VIPSVVLALLAAVIGFINLPFTNFEFLTDWLDPVFRGVTEPGASSFLQGATLDVVSVTIACIGIFFAWTVYRRGLADPEVDPLDRRLGPFGRLFGHAYYYDESISRFVDGPLRGSAGWLARVFDVGIIDGAVNGVGWLVRETGSGFRRLQSGFVRNYALGVVLGTVALLAYLLIWAAR
jgi:NADH-quinone oxidoreductase subunit L